MRSRSPELTVALALLLFGCAAHGAEAGPVASRPEPAASPGYVVAPAELPLGALALSGDVAALHAHRPVRFLVLADDLGKLERDLAAVHPEARVQDGAILVGRGVLPEPVEARHREPSFLIDADQPEIAELVARLPPEPDAQAVRQLVQGHFQQRQYGEFWTASRAARTRSGDCSEHAVLAAAVARRAGIAARVLIGYVTVTDGHSGAAVGHAWAQLHDGTRWVDVDATPLGDDAARSYIIAAELREEGPAYVMALFNSMGMLRATAITVVSAAEP
jgi:hypothetical protein